MINREFISRLCLEGESVCVDFKKTQYRFVNATDADKSELLKDILAMANADRNGPAYILIGVEERPDKLGNIVGIKHSDVIDDADLHQFVASKLNSQIPFSSHTVQSGIEEFDCIQVIEIAPCKNMRPFFLQRAFGKLEVNAVYFRDGTSTAKADPVRVAMMGEEKVLGKARPVVEKMHKSLTLDEKKAKVGNLLTGLRLQGKIKNTGTRTHSVWVLA